MATVFSPQRRTHILDIISGAEHRTDVAVAAIDTGDWSLAQRQVKLYNEYEGSLLMTSSSKRASFLRADGPGTSSPAILSPRQVSRDPFEALPSSLQHQESRPGPSATLPPASSTRAQSIATTHMTKQAALADFDSRESPRWSAGQVAPFNVQGQPLSKSRLQEKTKSEQESQVPSNSQVIATTWGPFRGRSREKEESGSDFPGKSQETVANHPNEREETVADHPSKRDEVAANNPNEREEILANHPSKREESAADHPNEREEIVADHPSERQEPATTHSNLRAAPVADLPGKREESVANHPNEREQTVEDHPSRRDEPVANHPSKRVGPVADLHLRPQGDVKFCKRCGEGSRRWRWRAWSCDACGCTQWLEGTTTHVLEAQPGPQCEIGGQQSASEDDEFHTPPDSPALSMSSHGRGDRPSFYSAGET